MRFDCQLATVAFFPIQLIFRSTVQLTGQKFESRLETWYEQSYKSNMKYESHFEHGKSKNPCANSNPNFRSSVQGDVLSRANPNPVWSPKSLVRGNLDKMRGKILGYNISNNGFGRRKREQHPILALDGNKR